MAFFWKGDRCLQPLFITPFLFRLSAFSCIVDAGFIAEGLVAWCAWWIGDLQTAGYCLVESGPVGGCGPAGVVGVAFTFFCTVRIHISLSLSGKENRESLHWYSTPPTFFTSPIHSAACALVLAISNAAIKEKRGILTTQSDLRDLF